MEQAIAIIKDMYNKYRRVFFASVIAGLFSYGFAMTNILHNHDSIFYLPNGYGEGYSHGRWFLVLLGDFVGKWWGNYSLPLFSGLLAILFISVACCLIIHLLQVQNPWFAVLAAGVFITFPSLGGVMLYNFMVQYYAFGVLLAVLCAWLTDRYPLGFLAGGFLLSLSMGIYQAFFPLAAALLLLSLLRRCFLWGDRPLRSLILTAFRCLAALILGLALYFIFLKLLLWYNNAALSEYAGIDQMGLSAAELPQMVWRAFSETLLLPLRPVYGVALSKVVRLSILVCHIFSLVLFLYLLIFSKLKTAFKLCAAFVFTLLPVAINLIVLMCYHSMIYELMAYGMVCVYFVPIVLWELAGSADICPPPKENAVRACRRCMAAILALVLALAAVNYAWQNHVNYTVLYYTDQQTVQYFSTMLTRIRSAEGYSQDKKLAIVGDLIIDTSYYNTIAETAGARYRGNFVAYTNVYSWRSWLDAYFAFAQPEATVEELYSVMTAEELAAMPAYPDDGSIRVIDDIIVLNLKYYR